MKILVGISGGVDSAVAAYLLKQQGHDIVGGFMLNYLDEENPQCSTKQDLESFYKVCSFLQIPFEILDFRKEYESKILNYIYEGYLSGITPNPDVLCNTEVKFRLFLDEALMMGYDYIATGHYAQIICNKETGGSVFELHRAKDLQKDQSYFLAGLDQYQLSHVLFPLGELLKTEVRSIAKEIGLPNAERKDSQGLCFVGNIAMSDFLREKIGERKGDIVLKDGSVVGTHSGAYQFTIGQRRGIGLHFQCYVCDIDVLGNKVVVTTDEYDHELYRSTFYLKNIHWIDKSPPFSDVLYCKLRYRQDLQKCSISFSDGGVLVHCEEPQKGVPNGQICVIYSSDGMVLGSGEIGS